MILRVLAVLALMMLAAAVLGAGTGVAAPRPLLADYTHTSWTEVDGAPSGATNFAQGPDGWLWIATPTGLYRFDGVRFERTGRIHGQPLASSNVLGLAATADGALWVGSRLGGVSVFRKDGAHAYTERDGLQQSGAMDIEAAPDGAIWAVMRDGVAVLAPGDTRFRYLREDVGLPSAGAFQVLFARDGTAWIGTNGGAYFRRPGDTRFRLAWPRHALVSLAEAPDGALWGKRFDQGYHRIHADPPPSGRAGRTARPAVPGIGMLFDRGGAAWLMHADGLERRSAPDVPAAPDQRLATSNGISGPLPGTMFQDREGNLWAGTARGIDRLRPNRLRTLPAAGQLQFPALVRAPTGEIWVGDYAGDLWRHDAGGPAERVLRGHLTASHTAADGTLWLGAMDGVLRRAPDGTLSLLPYPRPGLRAHALQQDRDGALWVSFNDGSGVYRLAGGRWRKSGDVAGIPEVLTPSMALDGQGRLWLAHLRSQVSVVNGAAVRTFGPADGLRLGTVLALLPDGAGLWAGGEHGVALHRDGRFVVLRGAGGEPFRGVSGIVRLPDGELWLHGADGLFRIGAQALARWLDALDAAGGAGGAAPPPDLDYERFDARDGMQGHAPQFRPVPSLVRAADGVLWYATTGSVGTLDPARIPRNRLAPPVHVTSVVADGARHAIPSAGALVLPQGTRGLELDFTATSLSIPERVRLRYRLVGLDPAWQEAPGRRQAIYTNLAPGRYRFEAIAANEDGVWNRAGATLDIDIPPTFVQSRTFTLLLAALAVLLAYAAYALRVRQLTRRMRERLHERLAERTRIARALHDTLLQSVQSLLLAFDAHRRTLPDDAPEGRRLERTLGLAEQLLAEGRDQIMVLRAARAPDVLEQTLEQFGKTLAEHWRHAFAMRVAGTPRRLRPAVREEVYSIAREALFNAARYAQAAHIDLELDYGAAAFAVRVRDDGCGIEEAVAAAGARTDHWGLVGMRERAACIGGALRIDSTPGQGTTITVTVPGNKAY